MVLRLFSRIHPERMLHVIFIASEDQQDGRIDLSPPEEYLQISLVHLPVDKGVAPHKHVPRSRTSTITQESWIVLDGAIDVQLFDVDDTVLDARTLTAGSVLLTLGGGHAFVAARSAARIIECKNGPYLGRDHVPLSRATPGAHV